MKRLIAVFLALAVMLTGFSLSAFAKDEVTPVIIVSGVGTRPFCMDRGTESEKQVFPPSTVDIEYILTTAVTGIAKAAVTGNMADFSQAVANVVSNIFEEFKCDENGNSKYNVTAQTYPLSLDNYDLDYTNDAPEIQIASAVANEIGGENTFFYNYDWRLDPCANADGLDNMVKYVKAQTGEDKVVLIPCSMGGVQTIAYLEKYGNDDIDSIIFMSAAHRGLYFVSELFTGSVSITQKDLFNFLSLLIRVPDENADDLISLLFSDLGETPYLSGLFGLVDDLLQGLNDENLWGALREAFGRFPGMWAFVRDEYYEEALEFMTDENTSPVLLEKIRYYHDNVGSKNDEILTRAKADGVKISICSHYGRGSVPVTPMACLEGDNLIETACTSNGATVAFVGETLGEDYVQAVDCGHNHLSADGKVDASTCLFPESTWFIDGQSHVGVFCNGEEFNDYADLVVWLATSEKQPTVHDNPAFPQFTKAVGENNDLEPIVENDDPADYFSVITALIYSVIKYVISLI